jgi:ribonucleoside-diphosphate reductase beta chain
MPLDVERLVLKPYEYPWAFEAWKAQHNVHWLPEEIPMADDVRDWRNSLNDGERHLVTQIFRFFTQSDVEVNNCYHRVYLNTFKVPEILMMLTAFSDMETIHVVSYSHLLDTLGMPEVEYSAFLEYKEMKDKFDYMREAIEGEKNSSDLALTLAIFGAFTEGLQLFASFAILLNFQRFNKLKGMGQIVTYSARDETIHCLSLIRLFHTWVHEHPEIDVPALQARILTAAQEIVHHEDAFIDLAFEAGPVEGLTPDEVKSYIRYMADKRLFELGMEPFYHIGDNPLPWMDAILNGVEFAAFFEQRSTEYSKNSTTGSWEDVWSGTEVQPLG